jgi:hypothetical protein
MSTALAETVNAGMKMFNVNGMSTGGGGYANFSDDEKIAFSEHINNCLEGVRCLCVCYFVFEWVVVFDALFLFEFGFVLRAGIARVAAFLPPLPPPFGQLLW